MTDHIKVSNRLLDPPLSLLSTFSCVVSDFFWIVGTVSVFMDKEELNEETVRERKWREKHFACV